MKSFLAVILSCFYFASFGQVNVKSEMNILNNCIARYGNLDPNPLTLFEASSIIEQKVGQVTQRVSLSEIGYIDVTSSKLGYSVNFKCNESSPCVNVLKSDMTSSSMNSYSFFFTEAGAANTFAEHFGALIMHYKSSEKTVTIKMYKDANGTIEFAKGMETPNAKFNEKKEDVAEVKKESVRSEKTIQQIQEEEMATENQDQVEPIKKVKSTKKRIDDEDEMNDEPVQKVTKRKTKIEDESEDAEERPRGRTKSTNTPIDDDPIDNLDETCKRLLTVINAGGSQFKSIEGAVTNPDKGINDSKLKLKGAKRNYITTYRGKRAFIAEYKSHVNFDILSEEFDLLQTELEDCLGGDWDYNDRSGNDEYENYKDELRDIEYVNTANKTMATMRILLLKNGGKYVLFVRIL